MMDRILIVEDDPALLRGLADNLRGEPYDVITATDGEAACEAIRQERPDLVLLDLTLPRLDGLEVCRRVRDAGIRTPIVMLTSRGEEADRLRGFEIGADDYLSKPFSLSELLARIRGILRHRREWLTEHGELGRELRSASEVQRRLMPQERPRVAGLDYGGVCLPARAIGGDYFDYFDAGPGRLGLLVADVSGKGMPAALLMAALQGSIRTNGPGLGERCGEVVARANALLFETTEASRYATIFYGVYDCSTRWLSYVNAGHVPPLLVDGAASYEPVDLDSTAPPIGLFPAPAFECRRTRLAPGSWLVLFSDGISETANGGDEEFGRERVRQILDVNGHRSASAVCDAIVRAVVEHGRSRPQFDDLTVVAAHVEG